MNGADVAPELSPADAERAALAVSSVDFAVSAAVTGARRVGLYTVERWGWRECYNTACTQ